MQTIFTRLRLTLITACVLALASLILLGALSYRWTVRADEDQQWVTHTQTVLDNLDGLWANVIAEERDQRNYVLVGTASYLAQYRSDRGPLEEGLNHLRGLTADNPRQQRSLDQLRSLLASRKDDLDAGVATRENSLAAGIAAVRAGVEGQSLERAQSIVNEMKGEESRLLADRLTAARRSSARMKAAVIWGNALAVFFLVVAAVAIYREMSKRKAVEESLAQSEERFRLMISRVKDYAILMLDPKGLVVSWNAGAERIKGYRAEEIIGQHFSRFYAQEDQERGKPQYELEVAADQGQFEDEGWRVRKDGSQFWANVVITAVRDDAGRLRGFSKVTRDMTERRRNEEEMALQNAQLAAANKELEAFSYSVSHDLRAPLRSIDGFSAALLEDYDDSLDEAGKNYLSRIRAAAARMGSLIDDMLKLARISRCQLIREEVDLTQLAEEVAMQLRAEEPNRQVRFSIMPGVTALGDRNLLRIVMENLLGNAWKFTSKQQHALIEVGVEENKGEHVVFVRDDGPGFDMRYVDKLFGVFQRLHRDSEFPGTGVGLATVQRIIHRHAGRVWAEAASGRGASFYFALQTLPERTLAVQGEQ